MPIVFSLSGVYLPGATLLLLALLPVYALLDRLLVVSGFYRWLWHPALFRMALVIGLYALGILVFLG